MSLQKKFSLRELIDNVDWIAITNKKSHFNPRMGDNEIHVGFRRKTKGSKIDRVRIRIGKDVMKILGWNFKDKINISHHPDDLLSFRLIKSESGAGYKLKNQAGCTNGLIDFVWDLELPLRERKASPVEYFTPRDEYVVFRVPMSDA